MTAIRPPAPGRRVSSAHLAAIVAGLTACSCGLVETVACGEGTVAIDGVCVPADAGGPDASNDASVFDSAAAPNTDGAPDVEVADARDSETDASGDTDVIAPDSAPESSPDADDASTQDGEAPPALDAAALDEPCPTGPFLADCSGQCGDPADLLSICKQLKCGLVPAPRYMLTIGDNLPLTLRTPSHPGTDPKCLECGKIVVGIKPAYGLYFTVNNPTNKRFAIEVAPPWFVGSASDQLCPVTRGLSCVSDPPTTWIAIYTDDPDAPARNVVIRLAGSSPCPN